MSIRHHARKHAAKKKKLRSKALKLAKNRTGRQRWGVPSRGRGGSSRRHH